MSRFRQQSFALEDAAQVPRSSSFRTLRLVDHDGVQESFSSDFGDPSSIGSYTFQGGESRSHLLSEVFGSIAEIFVDDDFERGLSDGASERVL